MYIVNREREAAQALSLTGALALADIAGWKIDRSIPILPVPFKNYLYIPGAELLLVPSAEPSRGDLPTIGRSMREARSDALVVKASTAGRRTLYCAFGEWRPKSNDWHIGQRLWLSRTNEPWLIPDPAEQNESDAAFRITAGRLRVSAPPVYDSGSPGPGLDRADAYLAAAWECR